MLDFLLFHSFLISRLYRCIVI